jgi:hypothetical protein
MLKLTIDSIVLKKLKLAMPKTDKAERALENYVSALEFHVNRSMLYMEDNRYRFFKHFVVSTHQLMLDTRQFVINGQKQYLHTWLGDNNLELVQVVTKGQIGQEHSTVKLTSLIKVVDQLDLAELGKKEINQIDVWLNNPNLSDEDFVEKIFPDIFSYQNPSDVYDYVPIDIVSLQRYIAWLIKKAQHFNSVQKQIMLRQAYIIFRVAQICDKKFIQKKNPSFFGRNYYHGINVQSVHTSLREAMLGNCYEYDLRSAAISWKLGFANDLLVAENSSDSIEGEFGATLFYLQDKTAFMNYVIAATFNNSSVNQEFKVGIIKQALTALGFGAQMKTQGWFVKGKSFNPALVKIIKNKDERENFVNCDMIMSFMEEQKRLDHYIFEHFTKVVCPDLLRERQLQTNSGRISKSKIMAWLFQHAETHVMELVAAEIEKTNNEVFARVHDAIFVKYKISDYGREKIEELICAKTNIPYWRLKEKQIKRYEGVSEEMLRDEQLHCAQIAAETALAENYKSNLPPAN